MHYHLRPSTNPIPVQTLQAVLFDLDGTLIDTDDQAVEKAAKRLRYLGRHAQPMARWLLMRAETPGNAFITLLDWLNLDVPMMRFTDWLRRRRGLYPAPDFRLIPGVAEMLARVAGVYPLGIVTTRSRYHIDAFLSQNPTLAPLFRVSCGLQDTHRLKPHPGPVRLAARLLNLPVDQCLMVGDTTVDVLSARRAGAWSVGVLCGFGEPAELERAGAHALLPTTAELADFLGVP